MFECVVNVSEGQNVLWLDRLANETVGCVDLHVDADHNRSVFTILGHAQPLVDSVLNFSQEVVETLDLNEHDGVHPRIGVLDVVPFVPLGHATLRDAAVLRDLTAHRLSEELSLPCFLYGPKGDETRTLPSIRSKAFQGLEPDVGPRDPHPFAGAVAVGARLALVAWNIWLSGITLTEAKRLATSVRSPHVRALGLQVGPSLQVSCNLLEPTVTTPEEVLGLVQDQLIDPESFLRCELVGLAPRGVLDVIAPARWSVLDLSEAATIEHAAALLDLAL